MKKTGWQKRLLESTRGQILELLRTKVRTVNELADALRLTDNAVRAHLLSLERDGLVSQAENNRGFENRMQRTRSQRTRSKFSRRLTAPCSTSF